MSANKSLLPVADKLVPACTRALELDPDQSGALIFKAMYERSVDWNWYKAERLLRRAQAISRDPANKRMALAFSLLLPVGRIEEAEQLLKGAMELDPLNSVSKRLYAVLLIVKRD